MALLAFILRVILFLFVLRLAVVVLRSFFGGFVQGNRPRGKAGPPGSSGSAPLGQVEELVKDPVCGVHTAKSTAIAGRYQGAPAYFCSEECAAKARAI